MSNYLDLVGDGDALIEVSGIQLDKNVKNKDNWAKL